MVTLLTVSNVQKPFEAANGDGRTFNQRSTSIQPAFNQHSTSIQPSSILPVISISLHQSPSVSISLHQSPSVSIIGMAHDQPVHSIESLAIIARWFNHFATHPIKSLPFQDLLPLSGFTILHSLRIAYLYHSILHSQGVKVGGGRKIDVSFLQSGLVCTTLVMSGTTMSSILQGKPSSLLSEGTGELVTAYMLASFLMKWLHPIIAKLPQLPIQLLSFFIDGFATTFGTLSLGLIPILKDAKFQSSSTGDPLILPMIIIPLLSGSGASLIVPVFGLFKPRFSFDHPGFLSESLSVDIWSPWLISLCYGTIVDGRGLLFGGTRHLLRNGIPFNNSTRSIHKESNPPQPWMRPDEAHVLCSLLLSMIYFINEFGPRIFSQTLSTSSSSSKRKTTNGKKLTASEKNADVIVATALQDSPAQLSHRKNKK